MKKLVLSTLCLFLLSVGSLSAAAFTVQPGVPAVTLSAIFTGTSLVAPTILGSEALIQDGTSLPVIVTAGATPPDPNLALLGTDGLEFITIGFDPSTLVATPDFSTAFIEGTGTSLFPPTTASQLADLLGARTYVFGAPVVLTFGEVTVYTYELGGIANQGNDSPVPEPGTFLLMGLGLGSVYVFRRRRSS